MTWVDCDNALLAVNAASYELGWERYEELLLRVKTEIENHCGNTVRLQLKFPVMIRPRTMKLMARLRVELKKIATTGKPDAAIFAELHLKIHSWLSQALTAPGG